MAIAGNMLPKVSNFQVTTSHNRSWSQAEGGMLFVNRTDSIIQPYAYNVTWSNRSREHVDAIWQHYQTHASGTFKWIGPEATIEQTWRWATAPKVKWTSARTASVVADVELALAFIP